MRLYLAASLASLIVLSGCGQITNLTRSEAWKAGQSFGSKLSSESFMEAFAGCQFAQPQVYPTSSNSEYEDFMDGCTSAALGGSEKTSGGSTGGQANSVTTAPTPGQTSNETGTLSEAGSGQDAFQTGLRLLQDLDPQGEWYADPINDLVTGSNGVILDAGSHYPDGCAAWWYGSKSDLENGGLLSDPDTLWTQHYYAWELPRGPAVVLLANSPSDRCLTGFLAATGLKLEQSFPLAQSQAPLIWEPEFSISKFGEFKSSVSSCTTFACAYGQIKFQFNPPTEIQQLDLVFFSQGKLVGRTLETIQEGKASSLLEVQFAGLQNDGKNLLDLEIYDSFSSKLLSREQLEISVSLSPIEKLFAGNPAAFGDWSTSGYRQLSDPYSIAEELMNAGICDRVSDLGSRVRCSSSSSTGLAPGYDAYIYTQAADIVSLTQGYTYDNTVFYSSNWAVAVYYPGWTASKTDVVEEMSALNWSVIGQDWRDPASCIGSCFVSR